MIINLIAGFSFGFILGVTWTVSIVEDARKDPTSAPYRGNEKKLPEL